MEITRRTTGDWTDLVVEGRLDGYWAEHLDAGIAEAIREGGLRLRLDLEKVTFLSSAGIGVLVKFHKRLAAVKGSLVIARLSAPVKTVLEMTRLTALLVATGEGVGDVTLTVGSTLSRHGLLCEVFDLNPSARMLKELTVLGYFSSEIGATQALAYDKVPGGYWGCLDLKPGQKGWATR